MAYQYPAVVAFSSNGNSVVRNAVFQAYAPSDTGFTTPLAITDTLGNTLANLNSGPLGVFPAFVQAQYMSVVLSDTPNHQYAWTVPAALAGAVMPWTSGTYYTQGQAALDPNGCLIVAKAAHTSGASYTSANWTNPTYTNGSGLRSSTYFGLGAGVGADRMPYYQNSLIDGSTLSNTLAATGADDYVGHQINVTFKGGFQNLKTMLAGSMTAGSTTLTLTSGTFTSPVQVGYNVRVAGAGAGGADLIAKISSITDSTDAVLNTAAGTTVTGATVTASLAPDPNYLFGANDFFASGSNAGDLSGIDNLFGRLTEIHLYTPNATIGTIKASSSEADIESSANGSTVTTVIGHHIHNIRNSSTATITNAYNLFIDGGATTGATNKYELYVNNGTQSKISGKTTLAGNAAADTPLTLQLPLNPTGQFLAGYDVTMSNRLFHVANNGSIGSNSFLTAFEGLGSQTMIGSVTGGYAGIRMGSGSDAELRRTASGVIEASGKHKWVAANVQTTVGAAGTASALPTAPSKYLQIVGDDGTTYVIPAYKAA